MEQGFYVEPAGSISEQLATRLELEPASTHMLVGGIGSGKTTQLLKTQERLNSLGDIRVFYIDVLERQRLDRLDRQGVLLALVGLEVSQAVVADPVPKEIVDAQQEIDVFAGGQWIHYTDLHDPGDVPLYEKYVWKSGVIASPDSNDDLERLEQAIQTITSALPYTPVMLLDGLDRVSDISTFAKLVSLDIQLLKRIGIGVVVVAPQHARTWQQGSMGDFFDELHLHGAASASDAAGLAFLQSVLRARVADSELLPDAVCAQIAHWSGGIVRDLLALARASAEEAYRVGADAIEEAHVRAAADRFGRNLLVGIEQEMITRLESLVPNQAARRPYKPLSFTVATETDVMLLLRRLVIEVPVAPVHYILHPTIVSLIAGLRRRA